jgi:hypothetical protein
MEWMTPIIVVFGSCCWQMDDEMLYDPLEEMEHHNFPYDYSPLCVAPRAGSTAFAIPAI